MSSIEAALIRRIACAGCAVALLYAHGALAAGIGDWPMAAHDYASTRYSPLDKIDTRNVSTLHPVFTFATGIPKGHEAAPVVVDNTMYVVTPYPNVVYALDLTSPSPSVKWKFEPVPAPASQGVACCDVVNRGVAYADGRVFMDTLDNQVIAIDAKTGRELWRTSMGDIRNGETMTMAPLVVRDKVLVGNSGGEFGVRGWLAALDAATGKVAWKAFSTGPDRDVLINDQFRPFYAFDRGTDLGTSTWPGESWKIGGGTVWGWLSYDPELDLIFYGTANPGPWNPEQRPGDNKWTSGLFARDPATGSAHWFYQMSPHDLHDYDGVNESILVDLPIGGKQRKVLLHPDRNGYVYVIDRTSGEVLSATPFVPITTTSGVDLSSGRLQWIANMNPQVGKVIHDICPASPGGKDWQPSAWSPRTGLMYIPHQDICQDAQTSGVSYIRGTPYVGITIMMKPGPGGHRGLLTAWDPIKKQKAWQVNEDLPVWSGALATAGDLVFYGTLDGWFKAVDARSGKLLWQFQTGSGIVGQPIAYQGPDGKEYVAVLSGIGGWPGAIVTSDLDTRDKSAATGFANLLPDLKQRTRTGGTLYVFGL